LRRGSCSGAPIGHQKCMRNISQIGAQGQLTPFQCFLSQPEEWSKIRQIKWHKQNRLYFAVSLTSSPEYYLVGKHPHTHTHTHTHFTWYLVWMYSQRYSFCCFEGISDEVLKSTQWVLFTKIYRHYVLLIPQLSS
jgi:hypothetical protein